jgi:thiosulfate reductase cytochrome b subunit
LIYGLSGILTNHFRKDLLSATHRNEDALLNYNRFQRVVYLAVIFLLFPLMIWTGLAMSPALTSVFPPLVTTFGGQQSARTIHFFAACFLMLFLLVHVSMVSMSGFRPRMRAMIVGTP